MAETLAWLNAFPELKLISDRSWMAAAEKAQLMDVPKGAVLFRDGDVCNGYVFVTDGAVRVQKMDPQGREIVLYRVEDVAFGRMDVRLARLLLKRSREAGTELNCTHQELATELGTAREVVSRLLKDFERKGWLALSRSRVEVKERHALEALHEE